MSLFEILVILIVSLLVMKSEDIPKIIKKIQEFKNFITNTKQEILSHFDQGVLTNKNSNNDLLEHEIDQVNFYLEKISKLGSEYNGDYSLISIKNHYRQLMNKKIAEEIKNSKQV
ncbi:MAG: DUF2672 domain-containing protein [Rickettsiales bacterium]|nr:MAG: DUF2672 domain-containing protein [Rickettsiales bacterium]